MASSGWLGAVASGASGLFGSVASLINQGQANKAADYYQRREFDMNLDMWNRQNLYNSPAAQMQRYKDAGLNPNMIYGSGTASAGNASTLPRYQAPQMRYTWQPPNPMEMLSLYTDLKVKQEQGRYMAAQADMKEAEAKYSTVLAAARAGMASDSRELLQIRRIMGQAEFSRVFTMGNNGWTVKPEYEQDFMDQIVSKLRMPTVVLGRTQQDVRRLEIDNALSKIDLGMAESYGSKWWGPVMKALGIGANTFVGLKRIK